MSETSPCASEHLVDRHFALATSRTEERELREHLVDCASCRARYERHLLLSKLDPAAPGFEERLARGLGWRWTPERVPRRVYSFGIGLAAAAAVAMALFIVVPRTDEGFHARGTPLQENVALRVYRIAAGNAARPLDTRMGTEDELAFAYDNHTDKRYLMVLAVDEHRHVYWYYPRWTDPAADPPAIPISNDATARELPDAVSQQLDGSHLVIEALFLDRPRTVREIEERIQKVGQGPLTIDGALVQRQAVEVSH